MRLFITFCCFYWCSISLFAQQVEQVNISTNPIVQHKATQLKTAQDEYIVAKFGASLLSNDKNGGPCPLPLPGVLYLMPNDTFSVCLDTAGLGGGTFTVTTAFGGGTLNIDSTCFKYTSLAAPSGALLDTLTAIVCDAEGVCLPFQYLIVNRREGTSSVVIPTITMNAESNQLITVDTSSLVGAVVCNNLFCNNDELGVVNFNANQFAYEAQRFAGQDTICFVACDGFTICDTFIYYIDINRPSIALPFFDDFSYEGVYPQSDLWLDDKVFVNRHLSGPPPSLGVATFDGLDKTGTPYGTGDGVCDILSSAYINIFANTIADNIYLSFYIEPKGYGFQPNINQNDRVLVQFLNSSDQWITMDTVQAISLVQSDSIPPFSFHAIPVNDPQFFSNHFQFRFVAYGNRQGIFDIWHLDYVRLAANEQGDPVFSDVALSTAPESILARYSSMPWRHFKDHEADELRTTSNANIYSHFGNTISITESGVKIEELTTGYQPLSPYVLATGNIAPGLQFIPKDIVDFAGYLASLEVANPMPDAPLYFETTYNIVNNSQADYDGVLRNDTARHITIFSDYFAYDDGTCESAARANGAGTQLALKYHSNIDDTLKAIQFHFPHLNYDASAQLFNLQVWVDSLDETPDFESILRKPFFPDVYRDTLQAFTTYLLTDDLNDDAPKPLYLPAGKDFYIGWQQVSADQFGVPVGIDMQHPDANSYIYKRSPGGVWSSASNSIKGALMLRPVLGDIADSQILPIEVPQSTSQMTIFPNPASNIINIRFENDINDANYQIIDITGKIVQTGIVAHTIDINNLVSGMYFLRIIDNANNKLHIHKLIVSK